jgi:type II secretory pathway component GspD/PulD (secretin)
LNVNETSSTSGANTTTVETGFNIEIVPFYDAEDNLVTVELDLEMKSLVGFKELNAGEQLGTLTRPQIQDQSIKNIARMEAGETALIGGLVYESASDNRTGLAGFEHIPMGSKSQRNSYNALFILMRPTVVVYGPRSEQNEVPNR